MPGPPRDRRQYKAIPYPMPHIFPPPSEEAWNSLGVTAPLHVDTSDKRPASTIHSYLRHQEKTMVANAPVRDSDRLLQIAREHGFELVRDDARGRLLKYGTSRFNLPPMGDANSSVSEAIISIATELDRKAERRQQPKLPTMVEWQGEAWAVYTHNAAQYNLQSLKDGHRVWVDKQEVSEVSASTPYSNGREPTPDPEAVARMEAAHTPEPEPVVEQPAPEPAFPTMTVHQAESFDEVSPLAYSRNEMKKQIERTQVRIAQEEAKIRPLYDQLAAFQAAYAALSGGIAAATSTPQAPRRTVLPPTHSDGRGGARMGVPHMQRLTYEERKKIRDLLSDGLEVTQIVDRMPNVKPYHVYTQKKAMAEGKDLLRN